MHFAPSSSSSAGSASPSLSLHTGTADDSLSTLGDQRHLANGTGMVATCSAADAHADGTLNMQIFVPDLQIQKCLSVSLDELVWDIKRRLLHSLPQQLDKAFNYGLFLPPCDGRAGKFLLEDRHIRDYPFHDCVPYVELKFKKRVYKMLGVDEKALSAVHSRTNLRKMVEAVQGRNAAKVERLCAQGMDPNLHDAHGESLLTSAAGIEENRAVIVQLVGGGAHLDFRNAEGQTCMHKAAFLSVADNVRTLLELGASPNFRDLIGLTPLYYNMLNTDSNPEVAQMLLAEAAELDVVDMHGNSAMHQACKNGLAKHVELLIYYGADFNARNINGNTPLHVCAVNGRVDCAQVLLYRGADPSMLNRQGQNPVQVAQFVGTLAVAEVIQGHDPHNIGTTVGQATAQFCASDLPPPPPPSSTAANPSALPHNNRALPPPSPPRPPSPPPSVPPSADQIRCASVKLGRASATRRISAVELEQLMVSQPQQHHGIPTKAMPMPCTTTAAAADGGPKKFTSVNEMKRRKQQNAQQQQQIRSNGYGTINAMDGATTPLKNSNSSPDLHGTPEFRAVLRPKTPPPPPPAQKATTAMNRHNGTVRVVNAAAPTAATAGPSGGRQPQQQPVYASTVLVQVHNDPSASAHSAEMPSLPVRNNNAGTNVPAPPPPPPPNWLKQPLTQKQSVSSTEENGSQPRASTSTSLASTQEKCASGNADCRGVSAEALQSIRLKPVKRDECMSSSGTSNGSSTPTISQPSGKVVPPANFDSDLRSALAKRRSKVRVAEEKGGGEADKNGQDTATMSSSTCNTTTEDSSSSGVTMVNRYNTGLSLRESVLENVAAGSAKGANGCAGGVVKSMPNSHSPTGAFIGSKKDSGYTSSRTSLEPSEYGDTDHHHQQTMAAPALPVQHRVTVLSQQMEAAATAGQSSVALRGLSPPPATKLLTGARICKNFCAETTEASYEPGTEVSFWLGTQLSTD
uniref:ANK_REP_REGION domain-containing protein n=1 Tax=Globodera pallida TaxID=36090 RepID=A0A183BWD6_GLOPA